MIESQEFAHWTRTIGSIVLLLAILGLWNITKSCDSDDKAHQERIASGAETPPKEISMWSRQNRVGYPVTPPRRELANIEVPAHGYAMLEWHRQEAVWWEVPQGVKITREWEDPGTHQVMDKDPEELDRQFAPPTHRGNLVIARVRLDAKNFSYPVQAVLYGDVAPGDSNWSLHASPPSR